VPSVEFLYVGGLYGRSCVELKNTDDKKARLGGGQKRFFAASLVSYLLYFSPIHKKLGCFAFVAQCHEVVLLALTLQTCDGLISVPSLEVYLL
jgi:hypothetical protein